jgi:hypothetical protein
VLCKAKYGSEIPKLDRSVNYPDVWWKSRDESRRCFGTNVGCYSLLVFWRDTSSSTALVDIGGLVALFGVRLVADFLFCWPLPMATRRFRGLLIGFILLLTTITLGPLLLLCLFFTPFSIGGRRVTSSWPRAALRAPLPKLLLHRPQGGKIMPSLGPPLGGGLLGLTTDLHSHFWISKRIRK